MPPMVAVAAFSTSGLVQWGLKQIIPLLLLVIGVGIIARARSGKFAENAATFMNVTLGVVVIFSATALLAFAGQITDLLSGSP